MRKGMNKVNRPTWLASLLSEKVGQTDRQTYRQTDRQTDKQTELLNSEDV